MCDLLIQQGNDLLLFVVPCQELNDAIILYISVVIGLLGKVTVDLCVIVGNSNRTYRKGNS
jgi:hypothetical protein